MTHYDIFNGDADGICSLHQLRLANPIKSRLITGTKREIALVATIKPKLGDHLTILDIALEKNRDALLSQLNSGVSAEYFDHHNPGDGLAHNNLTTYIDTSAETCTSLIVNHHLNGRFLLWAITGAYGDNLIQIADQLAKSADLSPSQRALLLELGTYLNYNGYGLSLDDLYFHPEELYCAVAEHESPFSFIEQSNAFKTLKKGYREDMASAAKTDAELIDRNVALYIIPDEPWARRVSGVWGNALSQQSPDRAHAILTIIEKQGYRVSVRAPMNNKQGADELCMKFPTGGGRKGAAGINLLPETQYADFCKELVKQYA